MTALRSGFSDLLAPGLSEVVAASYKQYPDEYTKIFNVETSERKYETTTTIEGLPIAPVKTEGTSVTYNDLTQGYDKNHTHITYGEGFRVSREMYDDDLYGIMKRAAAYLGRAIKQRTEVGAANVFNNGWQTGAAYLGPDGIELFSRVHPWARGGTAVNEPASPVDLSLASLEAGITAIETLTEASGSPVQLIVKTLLVPANLRWEASVLLESQYEPGNANNDKNPITNLDLSWTINHYLTDTDAWFLLAEGNELKFYMRQKPVFENDDDFDTKDAKFTCTTRFATGWADWPGTYGSPGV
uniref:Putative capsid protein n=1 Tax=viral metagenome TaxID=1070528 RepID=A0A6H1ZCM2_9ZZZZ